MIEFFTDPVLRAPTLGCMFMCIASSLIGVLVFLRKQSLLGESLSHAAYPGALLGMVIMASFFPAFEEWSFLAVMGGALLSSYFGLKAIGRLEKTVRTDVALTFILSVFFGAGHLIASAMQRTFPVGYKQVQMLLFGQAATMNDQHIWVYGALALISALFLFAAFRPLQAFLFDKNFATALKLPVTTLERIFSLLLLLSLVIGIRSVGIVLMSSMVIAPAVAARGFSKRLSRVFLLSALFGAVSGLLGNCLSVALELPTGPCIVVVGTSFALISLLYGLAFRLARIMSFRMKCLEENILKGMWKRGTFPVDGSLSVKWAVWRLKRAGWIEGRLLTSDGNRKASSIVRLHRLWELYLTESLGMKAERVHRTAEEMEHILTQEMEEKLTTLLENPKVDPHSQPIPERTL